MYTYRQSLALSRVYGSQWTHPDLSLTPLREIYQKYTKTYLKIHDSHTDTEVFMDLDTYRTELSETTLTVTEWLQAVSSVPLTTVEEPAHYSLTGARYENGVQRGYKYDLCKIGFPYPGNMPIEDLRDLKITRPTYPTDLTLLHTHCLNTVNGYFHRTDTDGSVAYVIDGGTTAMKARCSHTGILSFLDIGEIKQVKIEPENIVPLSEGDLLKEGILIRISEDITDKSVLFILGGFLIRPEPDVFYQVGENTWCLNLLGLPYFERILESQRHIDLSSMKLENADTSADDTYFQESALTDEAIMAYLTLSQTFFAIIDTPEIFFNKINVRTSNIPGMITAYDEPTAPLIMGYGKVIEYSKIEESTAWALRVADEWYVQYAWQTADMSSRQQLSSQYSTWKPYLRSQGYLLEIKAKKKD